MVDSTRLPTLLLLVLLFLTPVMLEVFEQMGIGALH
jgi:hypothetical protein